MFDSLMIKIQQLEGVKLETPQNIMINVDSDYRLVELYKGAIDYIHKELGVKLSTSKDLYKINKQMWNSLIEFLVEKSSEEKSSFDCFSFNSPYLYYLVDNNYNVVDVVKFTDGEQLDIFKNKLEQYIADVTTVDRTRKFYADSKDGTVKLVCYDSKDDIVEQDYTPVVIVEYNSNKSIYKVYTGILVYRTFTFIPSVGLYGDYDRVHQLIVNFDIMEALNHAKECGPELYELYQNFEKDNEQISVRELMRLLDKFGYRLQLQNDDSIGTIENISDEESVVDIVDFFNTFVGTTGETALDVIRLPELQKIFKYNKLTFMTLLHIISKEYLTFEGSKIKMDDIINIIFKLHSKAIDREQAERLKKIIQ